MQSFKNPLKTIAGQTVALTLFFAVYHIILKTIMRETGLDLGAINYSRHLVPLYAIPQPALRAWILPALIACIGFLYLCYKYSLPNRINTRQLLWITAGCFIAIHLSVAQIDGFREIETETGTYRTLALFEPYTRSSQEYYADVPKIDTLGLNVFLRDFSKPEVFNTLAGHTRTHPPGGVLFLWGISHIFGYNLITASLLSVLFTASTIVPLYKLSERLYSEKVARYALMLFLITPNFVMFTATSMDGPFSVFPILSLYLFYEAREHEMTPQLPLNAFRPYSVLTGLSLAVSMFMTYATVVIGVFFCVVAVLEHRRCAQYLKVFAFATIGFIGFYSILFVITEFHPLEALWASIKKDEAGMGTGFETMNRYLHISFANITAWLIGIGIPITVVWLRQCIATWKHTTHKNTHPLKWIVNLEKSDTFIIGSVITLLFFTFSTLFTMEVERIWIFMAPFFILPVAKYLTTRPISDTYWVTSLLVTQLILSEVLLYTYW